MIYYAHVIILPPPPSHDLQRNSNVCGVTFNGSHAISWFKGVLFIESHNKVREKLLHLARQALSSAWVRADPLTHKGRTRSDRDIRQGSDKDKETRGDVMIQGLWYQQAEAIISVKTGSAGADSYRF